MSDTPRTDAEAVKDGNEISGYSEVVDAQFARQLERELAEAKIGAARYEYVRKLNVREFAALTLFCNTSGIHFDTEVDQRRNQP